MVSLAAASRRVVVHNSGLLYVEENGCRDFTLAKSYPCGYSAQLTISFERAERESVLVHFLLYCKATARLPFYYRR
jgi:hypothetical protein